MIIEKALLTEKEKKRAKSSLELQIIKNQKEHEYILSFGKKFGYNTERWGQKTIKLKIIGKMP